MNERQPTPGETQSATSEQAASGQPVRIQIDDSQVSASYANLCLVSSTPEEVIVDFALNANPGVQPDRKIKLAQRVVLSHFTAKRLAALLNSTLQRHEQQFGPVEVDIRKRMQQPPQTGPAAK